MTILFPNYLQTQKYSAKKDRRVMSAAVMQEGIVHAGHFKVSQRGAGANQSVDVAAGEAWVDGDSAVDQGYYHVVNDATVNVPVAAANGSNPRIDAIVLNVVDSTEVGGSDEYKLESLTGTATAGASLANLTGAPAIGNTKLLLAYVLVPTSSTSVINERIGALADPREGLTGYPAKAEPKAVFGAPPQYAHGRPLGYVPATRVRHSVAQTPASRQALSFNTELYDPDGMHDTVTEPFKLFCRTPGFYHLEANGSTAAGQIWIIGLNGSEAKHDVAFANGAGTGGHVNTDLRLRYGDFVQCYIGASVEVSASSAGWTPHFAATWTGP